MSEEIISLGNILRYPAPIVVTKSDANLALSQTQNTWADVDPGGSAAARPLDLVIPGVKAGQWVEVEPNFYSGSTSAGIYLDVFAIVGGVPVSQFGLANEGVSGWTLLISTARFITGSRSKKLVSGDIENDSVRLRLRSRNATTISRAIAASAGNSFVLEGRGPFG